MEARGGGDESGCYAGNCDEKSERGAHRRSQKKVQEVEESSADSRRGDMRRSVEERCEEGLQDCVQGP